MLLQSKEADCGKSVIRNLLSYFNRDKGYYTCNLSSDCKSFYEIRNELKKHDIIYESCHVDNIIELRKDMFPLVCQMIQGDCYHFVIVHSLTFHKVSLFDPSFGEMVISTEEFLSRFTGRLMIFVSKGKRVKAREQMWLLKWHEKFLYFLCFLFQSCALSLALLFTGKEKPFLPCIVLSSCFFVFIIIQNALNFKVRHRLEQEMILSSLYEVRNKERLSITYRLITGSVKCASNTCSYAVLCVGLIILLLINSFYLSFLVLVSLLFYVLRLPLTEERNAVNRYCSIKEKELFALINNGEEERARKTFKMMRKRSELLLSTIVISWILEAFSIMIFSFAILSVFNVFTVNSLLFSTSLTLSFSYALNSAMKILSYPEEKAKEINALVDNCD